MSADAIDFTREDADRITRMEQLIIGMNDKLDALTSSISTCQTNCGTRRAGIDKRVEEIEFRHKEEDGTLKGKKSDFALTLSLFSVAATAITLYILVFRPS